MVSLAATNLVDLLALGASLIKYAFHMKDFRFYAEFERPIDKRKNNYKGTVFALYLPSLPDVEGAAGVYDRPNSAVCWTSADRGYLRTCKRVSEAKAREIHPRLFKYLDAGD